MFFKEFGTCLKYLFDLSSFNLIRKQNFENKYIMFEISLLSKSSTNKCPTNNMDFTVF